MLKYIFLILIALACSACAAYKYKAENENEFESLISEWLHWKFEGFSDQIENGEYQLTLLLSYDNEGYLIQCSIENNEKLKKFETDLCKALKNIGYPKASNQTINYPINIVMKM